jgi:hypothetical protein
VVESQLKSLRREFEAIRIDAERLLAGLDDACFNWRPSPDRWSIAQCVDHLVVSGRQSIYYIKEAINEARSKGLFGSGPFRYRFIERAFVKFMEPPPKLKVRSPRAYLPASEQQYELLVPDFLRLQDELIRLLEEADGIDLMKTRVQNPVTSLFSFSLGQEFALNAAHERRHLWQARKIKEQMRF